MPRQSGFTGKTSKVYSSARWKRLRRLKLGRNPLCEICERRGRPVMAVTVDHVIALAHGGKAYPPIEGLRSLCHRCHVLKTARHDHTRATAKHIRNAFTGSDSQGNPLDPSDPWNTS